MDCFNAFFMVKFPVIQKIPQVSLVVKYPLFSENPPVCTGSLQMSWVQSVDFFVCHARNDLKMMQNHQNVIFLGINNFFFTTQNENSPNILVGYFFCFRQKLPEIIFVYIYIYIFFLGGGVVFKLTWPPPRQKPMHAHQRSFSKSLGGAKFKETYFPS